MKINGKRLVKVIYNGTEMKHAYMGSSSIDWLKQPQTDTSGSGRALGSV